jgi:hypothetical protein
VKGGRVSSYIPQYARLIPVRLRLVRAFLRHAYVLGPFRGEDRQFRADLDEVESGNFLVQFLGEGLDADFVALVVAPQVEQGERLVGT